MTKYLITESGGPLVFLLYQMSFAVPFLLIISYFEYWRENSIVELITLRLILIFTFISVTAIVGFISLLNGFNEGNVSVGGIILSSRVVFAIPLAIIFLAETYEVLVYASILLAIIGSIIVSWDNSLDLKALFSLKAPGIRWYFLTTIFWSLSNFSIRYLEGAVPIFTLIIIRQFYMLTIGFAYYFSKYEKFSPNRKPLNLRLSGKLILYALILIAAQAGFVLGLGKSLTISEGIGVSEGTFTLIYTILIAKYIDNSVLKEPLDRKTVVVRSIGAVIAVTGTLGVIWFS